MLALMEELHSRFNMMDAPPSESVLSTKYKDENDTSVDLAWQETKQVSEFYSLKKLMLFEGKSLTVHYH